MGALAVDGPWLPCSAREHAYVGVWVEAGITNYVPVQQAMRSKLQGCNVEHHVA